MARLFDDGSSQYLEYGATPVVDEPITLSCWFNSDDIANQQVPLGVYHQSTDHMFLILLRGQAGGDPVAAYIQDGVTSGLAESSTGYSADTWHNAVAVFAASNDRRVYLDGGSKDTDSTSVPITVSPTRLGVGSFQSGGSRFSYMSGYVAEAAIWSAALTDAEVAILAAGYSPLLVRPQNLVAYWPLIGRTSPEVDNVGGYDMTLVAAPIAAAHPLIRNAAGELLSLSETPLYTKSLVNLSPLQAVPTTSNAAVLALRNRHPILAFDDTTDQSTVFDFVMPRTYGVGTDIAVILHSTAATATSGNAKVGISLERIGDGQQDVDSDGFAGVNNRVFTVPATSGFVKQSRIRFTAGVDMDSIAAGEKFRLKVTRLASDDADDMSGNWELHTVEIRGS